MPGSGATRVSRRALIVGGGLLAVGAALVAVWAASAPDSSGNRPTVSADGLPHTRIDVLSGACGRGWDRPRPGTQVFDVHNRSGVAVEVYLKDTRSGAVHGEVEGIGPGTTRSLRVDLGGGSYAFACCPDDAVPSPGPRSRCRAARARAARRPCPSAGTT